MRATRIILSIFLLVIIVISLAVGGILLFVDPNKFTPILIGEVKRQTGYQLNLEGKLKWSFYPRLSVQAKHMTLSAPNTAKPFLYLNDVNVATTLVSIMHKKDKLDGQVTIKSLKLGQVQFNNANIELQYRKNTLFIRNIDADFYSGKLQGQATIGELAQDPRYTLILHLRKVMVEPLIADLIREPSKLTFVGLADFDFNGVARGKKRVDFVSQLNGNSKLIINQGILKGIDINYYIRMVDALLNKATLPVASDMPQTLFNSMVGVFLIKNGQVNFEQVNIDSETFAANALGTIQLLPETLTVELDILSKQNHNSQWKIPLLIQGDLKAPQIRLNMDAVAKYLAAQHLDDLKDKVKKEVNKYLPGASDLMKQWIH